MIDVIVPISNKVAEEELAACLEFVRSKMEEAAERGAGHVTLFGLKIQPRMINRLVEDLTKDGFEVDFKKWARRGGLRKLTIRWISNVPKPHRSALASQLHT